MADEKLNNSKNDKNKIAQSNPLTKIYYNQIINNFDLNNIISNSSFSISDSKIFNNLEENESQKEKMKFDSRNSLEKKLIDKSNSNLFFLLLYKELISLTNKKDIDEKEHNKNISALSDNNSTIESIINIFKNTFIKIINIKTKKIEDALLQYKSTILLLEQKNRYYIKQNFLKQTKIDILENEIDSYMEMEEEFDEMKEKLKYENGKFLNNEKKENEILILRAENSNLKKIIDKNEKAIEEKEMIIETIKKKSISVINTNKNSMKNSFDLCEKETKDQHSSLVINKSNLLKPKIKFSHNNMNALKSKRFNVPVYEKEEYRTNNNSNCKISKSFHIKKISCGGKLSTKNSSCRELINKKLKNKVLNMKKIRRINEHCLDNYNKSSVHIINSIMSNNSNNNSSSKRTRKNVESNHKNNEMNISNNVNLRKKLTSDLTNCNINNISKYGTNQIKNRSKIIVHSILENNNNKGNKTSTMNNSKNKNFLIKTSDRKFYAPKKSKNKMKANLSNKKGEFILERNNYSLLKSPVTFNNSNLEKNKGAKKNIIINNFIQNASSAIRVPISSNLEQNKQKEKMNVSEFELKQNAVGCINNNKSGFLSVNIKKK